MNTKRLVLSTISVITVAIILVFVSRPTVEAANSPHQTAGTWPFSLQTIQIKSITYSPTPIPTNGSTYQTVFTWSFSLSAIGQVQITTLNASALTIASGSAGSSGPLATVTCRLLLDKKNLATFVGYIFNTGTFVSLDRTLTQSAIATGAHMLTLACTSTTTTIISDQRPVVSMNSNGTSFIIIS